MKQEKNLECHQNLLWQYKNILASNFPFHFAILLFFGMPVPHFDLLIGTWHTAISRSGRDVDIARKG